MATDDTFSLNRVLKAGILAGVTLAIFEMAASLVVGGPAQVLTPLRMIAAMALGPAALEPSYSPLVAVPVGVALHLLLSLIFAVMFSALIPVTFTTGTEVGLGMAYGFLLWIFNYYLICPALGWVWFAQQSSPPVQLAAHTIAFGAVLGWFRHYEWEVDEANVDPELHRWRALN